MLLVCICLCLYIHSRLCCRGTGHEGAICVIHIVYACNLYMFVFIYPFETFFVEELGTYEGALCACLHMEGHYVHVYGQL